MPQLSFTTMSTPTYDAFQAIEAALKYGYQGVDMRVSENKGEITLASPQSHLDEVKKCLSENNIQLAGLLCYNKTGNHTSKDSWLIMEDDIVKHLELAEKLGSPTIRIFGGPIHEQPNENDYITQMAKTLNNALKRNDKVDILLQHHHNSYNFMKGKALVDQTNSPRFNLVFSPDHCVIMHDNFDEVMPLAPQYCKQIYLADVRKNTDPNINREFEGILPGKGDVRLKEAVQCMGGKNFAGWISFKWEKIWQDHLEEPEIALPYFIEYFNKTLCP